MTSPETASAGFDPASRKRRQNSRQKLLAQGLSLICEKGYSRLAVEEIAQAAHVNRLTFYRHFGSKGDFVAELYKGLTSETVRRFVAISAMDYRDRTVVIAWLTGLFAADHDNRYLHEAFAAAFVDTRSLDEPARETLREIVRALGAGIPAFAVDPAVPEQHATWLRAVLLVFQILDQSSHAALGTGFADDPAMIGVIADQFLEFVNSGSAGT